MSLRTRLLVVVAALTVVGLVVANVATYEALRSFLIQRLDRTVNASAEPLARSAAFRGQPDPGELQQLSTSAPGSYVGLRFPSGTVQWGAPGVPPGEHAPPPPQLPDRVADRDSNLTLGATHGSTRYRARIEPIPGNSGYLLIVASPLKDVYDTLHRLVLIEVLVSVGVLLAIVGLGLWLVRVGLAPLGKIEDTAAAIAAGDLSRRIENTDERTEVGRLGRALNAMLHQIEGAFRERQRSEERLRRFVGDASHELRTPLSSVQAYAELFERGARDRPEDLARAMAGIERGAKRMGVLVDDLLLLARLDQGRPLDRKPVDLAEVAGDAVDAARAVDPDRPLELEAEPVVVEGDPERLRQVIDNLLANVRSHTPPGTPARVRVGRDNSSALVEVADEGPGLTEEQATHAFERFYRGSPSRSRDGGSSGLGLSIVAAIAQAHGGAVDVSSGPGATFRVVLPLERGVGGRPFG